MGLCVVLIDASKECCVKTQRRVHLFCEVPRPLLTAISDQLECPFVAKLGFQARSWQAVVVDVTG